MVRSFIKVSGLGVLLLTLLWFSSTTVQAATVTIDLCASTGTVALPNNVSVPVWGFVNNPGACAPDLVKALPGPAIQVNAGDTVVINLTNALGVRTGIVIAGQNVTATGGAPGVFTRQAIANGGTVSYSFVAKAGVYLYESGADNPTIQNAMGLYGALVVNSPTPGRVYSQPTSAFTRQAVLVLSEIDPNLNARPGTFDMLNYKPTYWLINGKAYPDTSAVVARAGDTLLLRYLNAGFDNFSMALLGAHQRVIAKNSFEIATPFFAVAETIPAGETLDTIVNIPAAPAQFSLPLYSRNLYVTNNGSGPGGMRTAIVNGAPPAGSAFYVSSSSNGAIGNLSFRDEDILAYNPETNRWSLVFDGSLVGILGDVDAFDFQADGTLLLSLDTPVSGLAGISGTVDDSDIIRFTPTTPGDYTAGGFSLFFDGSDVRLNTDGEDVDAFSFTNDGRLVVSTLDNFAVAPEVGGIAGQDKDLIVFNGTLGPNTTGTWQNYFDGSTFGLTTLAEDIWGVSLEGQRIYLTTLGNFTVPGANGNGSDIFVCITNAASLPGPITQCTFHTVWAGATYGFAGEIIDGLDVAPVMSGLVAAGLQQATATEATEANDGDSLNGDVSGDAESSEPTMNDEASDEEEAIETIFLPIVQQ